MIWTDEEKRRAAIEAPLGAGLRFADARIIERPGWLQIVTPSAPVGMQNEVLLSVLADEDVERAIDDAIATYHAVRHPVKWCIGPKTKPDDLGERLARRGFDGWKGRAMGVDTALAMRVPAGVEIVEVEEPELDAYVATTVEGWSLAREKTALVREAHAASFQARPRVMHCFGAVVDGAWLGTAALVLRGSYGYLLGSQVLASARGRGIYKALVATRLAFLRARGISYAVTLAREATSAPILERLGFETIFRTSYWVLPCPT
jgi:GNAT superfamily N-acetyltransferase